MVPARPNVAAGIPSSSVKHSKRSGNDDRHINIQFKKSPTKIPYKAIACATVQCLVGAVLVITGCLLLAGYLSNVGTSRAVPFLIVGVLVFLPGFYHLFVACRAHRGCRGYSYDDLPDLDD
ncbi:PREDICTED: transmembrane protein 230-like [Galeopterus variegatus]|uniref:Transmembrane protein 230 n=1 Tax=Galeopterus variegatus TaxID=482537 RepID=A0ABM0QC75_GALVR|nr:PREDICTED: transmembrane protein 230-like [Galeopterus variegatus]